MTRTRRTMAALVATAALTVPPAFAATAVAAERPHQATKVEKADKVKKAQTKQLLKSVAGKDRRLARLATSNAVTRLADATEAQLVATIDEARTALADVKAAVEAADSAVDTRAARKDLRQFRVVNLRLAVNILKQAEGLTEEAAVDAEAQEHLAAAEAAALEITATSPKADVRAARAHLREARAELESEETETTPAV